MNVTQQAIDTLARKLWDSFNESEKFGVRFGMFPGPKMTAAETELGGHDHRLTIALMNLASQNGGMRA
jgi:hypothetical protein